MPARTTPSWTNPGIPRRAPYPPTGQITRPATASLPRGWEFPRGTGGYQRPFGEPVPVTMDQQIAGAESQAILNEMRARAARSQQPPITQGPQVNGPINTRVNQTIGGPINDEAPDETGFMNTLMSEIRGNQSRLRGGYGDIMSQLQGNLNRPEETYEDYVPEEQVYSSSPENKRAMAMLEDYAKTGGYSEADQNNIRARGVAPIRSVYAQAQEGLNRQSALQGGYSPNKTAASSKMTRELADRIAGQTTNINADLAEKINAGKLQMAPQFAQFAGRENELINEILGRNVGNRNEASQFNRGMQSKVFQGNRSNRNDIMSQIQALFGTNADMTNTFTNQIMSHGEMAARNRQNRFQNRRVT